LVLYENLIPAFTSIDKLVNKRVITEAQPGQPECWAEIAFEHDSKRRFKRLCRVYNTMVILSIVKRISHVAGDDGRWALSHN